ncbi:hypothetical protein L1987_06365 [Smallanthus sonchifolius]|uniref:Uncharacterized protein n=1 Tax=Smallanthus sonchifolius TaxID=185202 RepID=A0ACB9JXY2_9ASTR|nr:hypothetical protein L1987_06365 [Smallanthus sonchifolius]
MIVHRSVLLRLSLRSSSSICVDFVGDAIVAGEVMAAVGGDASVGGDVRRGKLWRRLAVGGDAIIHRSCGGGWRP